MASNAYYQVCWQLLNFFLILAVHGLPISPILLIKPTVLVFYLRFSPLPGFVATQTDMERYYLFKDIQPSYPTYCFENWLLIEAKKELQVYCTLRAMRARGNYRCLINSSKCSSGLKWTPASCINCFYLDCKSCAMATVYQNQNRICQFLPQFQLLCSLLWDCPILWTWQRSYKLEWETAQERQKRRNSYTNNSVTLSFNLDSSIIYADIVLAN